MAELTPDSTIRQVLEEREAGRRLLYHHGYDVGSGFVDALSQYQSLREAARSGRLRDVEGLLKALNRAEPGLEQPTPTR
jgi:hypothetical protein